MYIDMVPETYHIIFTCLNHTVFLVIQTDYYVSIFSSCICQVAFICFNVALHLIMHRTQLSLETCFTRKYQEFVANLRLPLELQRSLALPYTGIHVGLIVVHVLISSMCLFLKVLIIEA